MRKVILVLAVLCALALSLWSFTPVEGADGFKIVVREDFPDDQVSKDEISAIVLKKKSSFSNGVKAIPVDQGKDSPVREAFSQAVHGRSTAAVDKFWQRQIFSGKDNPPREMKSDAEVLAFVRNTRGAIGYVSGNARLDGVKELRF